MGALAVSHRQARSRSFWTVPGAVCQSGSQTNFHDLCSAGVRASHSRPSGPIRARWVQLAREVAKRRPRSRAGRVGVRATPAPVELVGDHSSLARFPEIAKCVTGAMLGGCMRRATPAPVEPVRCNGGPAKDLPNEFPRAMLRGCPREPFSRQSYQFGFAGRRLPERLPNIWPKRRARRVHARATPAPVAPVRDR